MKRLHCPHSRRRFLQVSAAGAAGTLIGGLPNSASAVPSVLGVSPAWKDGMRINPQIDNLRVVFCHDPGMVPEPPNLMRFQKQNDAVDAARVHANMDRMAMALTRKDSAASAWAAVFQQPRGKAWSQVKAAVKVNAIIQSNCPRLAVIAKVCMELNRLGMPFGNIHVYDAGGSVQDWDSYESAYTKSNLPEGVVLTRTLGGEPVTITLPNGGEYICVPWLADETMDLLVNIAVNKGHVFSNCGDVTLTLKNHIGSIKLLDHPVKDDLWAMNQSREILGGTPPRQQLCIVDSLWASRQGPHSPPDFTPYCLVMGTCSPIVDYLTVKKIRENSKYYPESDNEPETHNQEVINKFLTEFGYDSASDAVKNLDLVDALSWQQAGIEKGGAPGSKGPASAGAVIILQGPGLKTDPSGLRVGLTYKNPDLTIFDIRGRAVRSFNLPEVLPEKTYIYWDGCNESGASVSSGKYFLRLKSDNQTVSQQLFFN